MIGGIVYGLKESVHFRTVDLTILHHLCQCMKLIPYSINMHVLLQKSFKYESFVTQMMLLHDVVNSDAIPSSRHEHMGFAAHLQNEYRNALAKY